MLVRFRADPETIRTAIRRDGDAWVATVSTRSPIPAVWTGLHKSPVRAMVIALVNADRAGCVGVDLAMSWSYEHPMLTLTPSG
jgi:hypothetical protein